MSRRRFEMFQYRQVLVRLRQGDTDREIARSRLMGRRKVTALRRLATEQGWLSLDSPLPDDAAIAAALSPSRRAASTISSAEPFRAGTAGRGASDMLQKPAEHRAIFLSSLQRRLRDFRFFADSIAIHCARSGSAP